MKLSQRVTEMPTQNLGRRADVFNRTGQKYPAGRVAKERPEGNTEIRGAPDVFRLVVPVHHAGGLRARKTEEKDPALRVQPVDPVTQSGLGHRAQNSAANGAKLRMRREGVLNVWRRRTWLWQKRAYFVSSRGKTDAMTDVPSPHIIITYCRQCNWLLRSAWMAQEILTTFSEETGAVTLVPGTGGIFQITCDGHMIWDRVPDGGFPEAKVLKQRLRDRLWPDRDLGHVDRDPP